MQISAKTRLVCLIVALLVFALGSLVGTGTYLIINHLNKSNASTETDYITTTNLFNTNGTINATAANALLEAVGYYDYSATTTGYKAHQITTRSTSTNTGNTIIFPMGYVNGTSGESIYWQATYLYNNYLTIWMVKGYTSSTWNSSSVNLSYSAYANSTIQNYLDNILWGTLTQNNSTLQSIFALPSTVGYQTSGSESLAYNNSDTSYRYGSTSTSTFDNLASSVYNSSYLWLPSFGEVCNNTSSSYDDESTTSYIGQWGLNSTDRALNATTYDGTSPLLYYCWLRSGTNSNNSYALLVRNDGSVGNLTVNNTLVIRPAAHLSLNTLNNIVGYQINASISGNNSYIQLDKTVDFFMPTQPSALTFTYTANTGYYVNSITINNLSVAILDSQPSSYSNVTGGQYMCYRKGNQVIVTVTNLTQDMTITGSANSLFDLASNNSTLIIQSSTTFTPNTYFDTTAEIVATFEQNQNIMFTIDGVAVRLYGNNSSGTVTVSSGTLNYSHNIHDNYVVIELTNLPKTHHTFTIDHYVGATSQITVNSAGGSGGDVQTYIEDNGLRRIVFSPTSDSEWVYSVTIDNIEVLIQYYKAEIYGAGGFSTIRYIAKDSTNTFTLEIEGVYESSHITFNLSTQKPTYQVPPTSSGGFGVSGTVVAAGIGGEARIVGNDIANGTNDDTVTFIAVAYTGYRFVGWVDASNETDIISTASSVRLTKDQTNGKIIKALFAPIDNSGINDATDDSEHDFV